MFPGEKSSLYRFLLIFISSALLLFAIALAVFFNYEKHHIIDNQNIHLKAQSSVISAELIKLHKSQEYELIYPQYPEFKSAIYDIDGNYLFGDFHPKSVQLNQIFYQQDDMLFYVQTLSSYYLGAAYIVVQKKIDYSSIDALIKKLIIAFIISIFFITLIAFWLAKLFLAPVRKSIRLLDDFIKDTTHELNTPISTILANAELLKSFYPEIESSKELKRIETASKRLSRIYEDLAYIRLNHQRHSNIQKLNISDFLSQRVEYFKTIADAKNITFSHEITQDVMLDIDKEDIARIIDNLLGNAFKYTMNKGKVSVILNKDFISIEDNGIGIDTDAKENILQRFVRANKSEGGFGLGLSIVADIAKFYNFTIDIQSEPNKGTKVSLLWEK